MRRASSAPGLKRTPFYSAAASMLEQPYDVGRNRSRHELDTVLRTQDMTAQHRRLKAMLASPILREDALRRECSKAKDKFTKISTQMAYTAFYKTKNIESTDPIFTPLRSEEEVAKHTDDRWRFCRAFFDGTINARDIDELKREVTGRIEEGEKVLRSLPTLYQGMVYEEGMKSCPADKQKYTLLRRVDAGFGVSAGGHGFILVDARCPSLPAQIGMTLEPALANHGGLPLPASRCPGRGEGCCDMPNLAFFRDETCNFQNDVRQGGIGDCWFLSAVVALAKYPGVIKKLFQSTTPGITQMPQESPNTYTVTLYDLSTRDGVTLLQPKDVVVNESLAFNAGGTLLGVKPYPEALWISYLEKAAALHCGGWDKLEGGQATHAWMLLTGCKDQFTIQEEEGALYRCLSQRDPKTGELPALANSPLDSAKSTLSSCPWPSVGGGGDEALDIHKLFQRMCQWHDAGYVMCAGERKTVKEGESHAYTVQTCVCLKAANGDDIELAKVRHPWGQAELGPAWGEWTNVPMGSGWTNYPEIAAICKPLSKDEGEFWVSKTEFFKKFDKVYLCAMNMRLSVG